MDFNLLRKYQDHLTSEFQNLPRNAKTFRYWSKTEVLNRLHKSFADFVATQLEPQISKAETKVDIPEWQPELTQNEEDEI